MPPWSAKKSVNPSAANSSRASLSSRQSAGRRGSNSCSKGRVCLRSSSRGSSKTAPSAAQKQQRGLSRRAATFCAEATDTSRSRVGPPKRRTTSLVMPHPSLCRPDSTAGSFPTRGSAQHGFDLRPRGGGDPGKTTGTPAEKSALEQPALFGGRGAVALQGEQAAL